MLSPIFRAVTPKCPGEATRIREGFSEETGLELHLTKWAGLGMRRRGAVCTAGRQTAGARAWKKGCIDSPPCCLECLMIT